MSEDLKKMKVTIEGDAKSLKKELGSARGDVRKTTDIFKNEIEKIKQSMSGKLPKVPQNISTTMRQSFQNIKAGAPFSAMAQDVKQYVKEAQLTAGIKVHTEEYEQTERDIERVSRSLDRLKQKKRDLMNSSGGTERSEAKKLNQDYAKSLSGTSSGLADNASNADKASKATEKYNVPNASI